MEETMKKSIAVLLSVACFGTLLSGCAPTASKPFGEVADYWTATSTVKYLNDGWDSAAKDYKAQDVTDEEKENKTLSFSGLKGEAAAYQIIFLAKEDVTNYNFQIDGDLTGEDGAKIAKEQLSVYAEHYFEIYQPAQTATYKPQTGYYPDALVPIDSYIAYDKDNVKKDWLQAIWVNLDIPRDCVAGEYTGTGTLTVNGASTKVEITAKVANVEIPEEVTPRSAFNIWYHFVADGEGHGLDTSKYNNYYHYLLENKLNASSFVSEGLLDEGVFEAYYEFMLTKRLTSADMVPAYTMFGLDDFLEGAVKASRDPRVTVYSGSEFIGSDGDATTLLTALMNKNLELRRAGDMETDLFEKLMIYKFDEPGVNGIPFDTIRNFDKNFYESKKTIKAQLAKVTDVDTTDLQESVMKAEHLVTFMSEGIDFRLIATEAEGGVQTWCPHMHWCWYSGEEGRQLITGRLNSTAREGGDDVWWYWCVAGAPGVSYFTDDIAVGPRTASWKQYELNISGTLYWNVCNYLYYNGAYYGARESIYDDPQTYGTLNGEGQLIYPGKDFGLKTPVSSIRLENIRDGQEDYEYLLLLENGVNKLEGFEGRGREVVNLFVASIMDVDGNYNRDHTVFDASQATLFELLDAVYNDAAAAKTMLENLLK